jgi:hypothetical protein
MDKKLLKKIFSTNTLIMAPSLIKLMLIRTYHEKIVFNLATKENRFRSIWRHNYWGNKESLSGAGSTLLQTENLRAKIPELFKLFGIESVFDAPCGDLNWMKLVIEESNVGYIGGDIVQEIVDANNNKISKLNVSFLKFDISLNSFPEADLWICRAILYHLSNADIYLALEKFASSNIKFMLTSNCVTREGHINKDINSGDWRELNLNLHPFYFPKKCLWEIDDYVEPHPPMKLSLWSREEIIKLLPVIRQNIRIDES